jgi:hypothetical protein
MHRRPAPGPQADGRGRLLLPTYFVSLGLLSASQAATKLGIAPQALEAMTSLIAVSTDDDVAGYPAFQFESQTMLDAVRRVSAAIEVDDPWMRLNFYFLRLQELDGNTAVEAIRAGEIDAVVLAASHFGEHGAS